MQALSILLKPLDGSSLAFASLIYEALWKILFLKEEILMIKQRSHSLLACQMMIYRAQLDMALEHNKVTLVAHLHV